MIKIDKDSDNDKEVNVYSTPDDQLLVISNNYDRIQISHKQLLRLIPTLDNQYKGFIKYGKFKT